MTVTCHDWRDSESAEITGLLRLEAEIWRRELGWNVAMSWRLIEPARAAGVLPGFVARDAAGRIVGWTWFLVHDGCLQLAALVADRAPVVRGLLDAVMHTDAARLADARVCAVRGTPPGFVEALEDHDLDVAPYAYQVAPLPACAPAAATGRPWRPGDEAAAAALLARSYAASGRARAFAPRGTDPEWRDYLHGLFERDGCGTFQPGASFVVDNPSGSLDAAIVVSFIDDGMAHLAQVAVDPAARRKGLGRRLVRDAMSACAAQGARRMSLLVEAGNQPARALYAALGFVDVETFVVASSARDQPRRSTSVALATGGVSTRR